MTESHGSRRLDRPISLMQFIAGVATLIAITFGLFVVIRVGLLALSAG